MLGTSNMTISRVTKDKNFTCLNTALIFDCNLSDTARILLIQMISVREETWNLNIEGLCKLLKRGIQVTKKALAELVKYGYLFKYQMKDEQTRQFGKNRYLFYESLSLNPYFGNDLSAPEKTAARKGPDFFEPVPSEQKPSDGQASQSNINPSNTKKLNTESACLSS